MLQRITRLWKRPNYGKTPNVGRLPCIATAERLGVRVRVFSYECKNEHPGYWFVIDQATDQKATWLQVAAVRDPRMQTIIDLLQVTFDSLDLGYRPLRSVRIREASYFIDEKLMQLRNVENPHDFFDLRKPE
jgi:hypothetical protein